MRFVLSIVLICGLTGLQHSLAQRVSSPNITVNVENRGVFECALNLSIFNFGNVDVDGTDFSTPNVVANGRNATNDGATYENASNSVTWICRAAPVNTFAIALNATIADHIGDISANNLEVGIPTIGSGTSTGYQLFLSQANLLTGLLVGNGPSAVTGDLNLRLNVLDADPVGFGVWVVRLRAVGSP